MRENRERIIAEATPREQHKFIAYPWATTIAEFNVFFFKTTFLESVDAWEKFVGYWCFGNWRNESKIILNNFFLSICLVQCVDEIKWNVQKCIRNNRICVQGKMRLIVTDPLFCSYGGGMGKMTRITGQTRPEGSQRSVTAKRAERMSERERERGKKIRE